MLPHRSRSAASAAERPFLAPGWLIALLAAIVGLVLLLLYPRTDLERRLAETPDTALSAAYLANLLRSDPDNPRLRLLLARQRLQMDKLDAARATLQPALGTPTTRRHATLPGGCCSRSAKPTTGACPPRLRPNAPRCSANMLRQMQQLAKRAPSLEQQIELAGKAYQYNAPRLGQALFKALAHRLDRHDRRRPAPCSTGPPRRPGPWRLPRLRRASPAGPQQQPRCAAGTAPFPRRAAGAAIRQPAAGRPGAW